MKLIYVGEIIDVLNGGITLQGCVELNQARKAWYYSQVKIQNFKCSGLGEAK